MTSFDLSLAYMAVLVRKKTDISYAIKKGFRVADVFPASTNSHYILNRTKQRKYVNFQCFTYFQYTIKPSSVRIRNAVATKIM